MEIKIYALYVRNAEKPNRRMNSQRLDVIRKQITKKIDKLVRLESHLKTEISLGDIDFKISRKIYACFDGFIILRTFSEINIEPFQFFVEPERLEVFIKNRLPIKTNEGYLSLYKLLKNSIGLELKRGQTLDLGSKGGGLTIGSRFRIDGFQIIIRDYENLEDAQETLSDIRFAQFTISEIQELEADNIALKKTIEDFEKNTNPLIITEGKTDWKYFISALKYFHSKNEFKNIDINWFLRFGSEEDIATNNCGTNFFLMNSVSSLNKILDSFTETRNLDLSDSFPVRIGIFDSDEKEAKERKDLKKNIYSFLIEPNGISTELLFSDEERKTKVSNRRLYSGKEFNIKTGRLIEDVSISIGNDNSTRNKIGTNKIIDSNVFDSANNNIALTKEEFSKSILSGEIEVGNESWDNFRHIFTKITECIKD